MTANAISAYLLVTLVIGFIVFAIRNVRRDRLAKQVHRPNSPASGNNPHDITRSAAEGVSASGWEH